MRKVSSTLKLQKINFEFTFHTHTDKFINENKNEKNVKKNQKYLKSFANVQKCYQIQKYLITSRNIQEIIS